MIEIDELSHLVTVNADLKLSSLEEKLNRQGFTLGYFYPPKNDASIAEVLMKKKPNLYSVLYGELSDLSVALSFKKNKEIFQTKIAPRQATGPSWKNFVLGSQKELGTVEQVVMKIFLFPKEIVYSVIGFSSFEECYLFERRLKRLELAPRCFGRFSKSIIQKKNLKIQKNILLILEWGSFQPMIDSILAQLKKEMIEADCILRVQNKEDKKNFEKILRREIPKVKWGGYLTQQESREVLNLKKELVRKLK